MEKVRARAVRHRGRARAAPGTMGSRSLQIGGQRGATTRARRCSPRRSTSPRTCSRRTPTTSCSTTAGLGVAGVPASTLLVGRARDRGEGRRKPPAGMGEPASRTSSTSTRATRRSRSARTSRSSRSTPRPAASSCCATSRSTTAAASSTRCSSRGQQHGGIAQGVAQALYEQVRLRRRRQPAHRQPHGLRDAERGGAAAFEA